MRVTPRVRRDSAHLVTQARLSRSEDIAQRERRYLIMMGIRVLCFVAAIALFVNGAGWLAGIPAVGAIVIPYFAVVFANGGREPSRTRGFREYQPNLPVPARGADGADASAGTNAASGTDGAGAEGGPGRPGGGAAPGAPAPDASAPHASAPHAAAPDR